jgi:hypothetical protein
LSSGPETTSNPARYRGERASRISSMSNRALSVMPNFTDRLPRSASMDSSSTHGRVASAALTFCGQVAQVIPGTLSTTVATTGFAVALARAGRVESPQPTTIAASKVAATHRVW